MGMIHNISEGFKNKYQMLAKRRPKAECNTVSAAMALIYTGHMLRPPEDVLPEDALMDILDSESGSEYLQSIVPGARYNPWNDSYCIAWAANLFVGKKVCTVKKITFEDMISHILDGGAVSIGGGFLNGKTYGHFVCVVGMEIDGEGNVTSVIVDDPYGNHNKGYVDHFDGNDIHIATKTFKKITFGRSKRKTMQLYAEQENSYGKA